MINRLPTWVLLAAITALGAFLRSRALGHAWEPDELSTLFHGATVLRLVTDPETAVNPPLLRVLFDVPFQEADALAYGRRFAWLCSVATIPAVFQLGRAWTGSRVVGLGAALLVALHPGAIVMGARFRGYGAWTLTLALHLLAVEAWSRARTRPREAAVVLTALFLPQWHYLGAFLLVAFAGGALGQPGLSGLWRRYVPAAAALLPYAPQILSDADTRLPHAESMVTTLTRMLALHVQTDRQLFGPLWNALPALRPTDADYVPTALAVAGLVLLSLRGEAPPLRRLLAAGVLGFLVAVLMSSRVQLVRSPVVLALLVIVAPLVAGALRGRWQVPGTLLAVALVGASFPRSAWRSATTSVYDALPTFLAAVHQYDDVRGDAPVTLWPPWTWVGAGFYLTGEHVLAFDTQPHRACGRHCFRAEDIAWQVIPDGAPMVAPPGLVATFRETPEGFAADCVELERGQGVTVWRCPGPP